MKENISVVTGATGHIGYALLKKLSEKGEKVRILLRKDSPIFDNIDCEKFYGDVTDPASLEKAFEGADVVYHLAGVIDITTGNEEMVWKVNFGGTENVVKACKETAVKKLIYASSIDAIAPLPGDEVTGEASSFNPDDHVGAYAKTKAAASQYVLDSICDGFEAVVVHPGACIGPYDFKTSNIGEMVRMYMRGLFPVSLGFGACSFVDIRDVADGMISAAEKGRNGECYILTGQTFTFYDFLCMIGNKTGKKPSKIKLGYRFTMAVAYVAEIFYKITGQTPFFTRYAVRTLCSNCNFSIRKAEKELDYHPMSVQQSINDMVDWIEEYESGKETAKAFQRV